MTSVVLLNGYLTRKSLEETWREIANYSASLNGDDREICLVISSDGGYSRATLGFVEKMTRAKENGLRFSAKIYCARSAAALIALTARRREIVKGGILEIHLGTVTIESCDINEEGRIPRRIALEARKAREETLRLLEQCGFPTNNSKMSRLLAANHLLLTAEECLTLGIAERIV